MPIPQGPLSGWGSFAQAPGPFQDPGYAPDTSDSAGPFTDPFAGDDDNDDDTDQFISIDDSP